MRKLTAEVIESLKTAGVEAGFEIQTFDQVGTAESGFFQLKFGSQNYTFETPSNLPMATRLAAVLAAL